MWVSFSSAAHAELLEAVAFYEERAPELGRALAAEVRSTVTKITDHPHAGFEVRPKIRRRLLLRFPYSLLYSVDAEAGQLHILALMHHRRGPARWEDRL